MALNVHRDVIGLIV